jgi:hypothetical protein
MLNFVRISRLLIGQYQQADRQSELALGINPTASYAESAEEWLHIRWYDDVL